MGIDEAGRGPVLGPMVYACACCPSEDIEALKEKAYVDSKTISKEERERLYVALKQDDRMAWNVDVITAKRLSGEMLRVDKCNLNAISHLSAMKLVSVALDAGYEVRELYVDTVGDPKRYAEALSERFPGIHVVVRSKADSLYPIVSAASIVAKVNRDVIVEGWKHVEDVPCDVDFGSGYPSDPNTVSWLDRCFHPIFGYPQVVRFSWSTCIRRLELHGKKVSWPCEASEERDLGQKKIPFHEKTKKMDGFEDPVVLDGKRSPYFKSRKLFRLKGCF